MEPIGQTPDGRPIFMQGGQQVVRDGNRYRPLYREDMLDERATAAPPQRVNALEQMFNGTGIPERVNVVNSLFNPVTALQEAGQHSVNMLAPGRAPTQRISDAGKMLTGMAGTVAPMWAASRGAMPAANALVDGLTGWTPTGAPQFMADEFGGLKLDMRGDYAGLHTAPVMNKGATLDNPADIWGDDIYRNEAMQWFGTGNPGLDAESFRVIKAARGNPNAAVTVYRAVPKDAPDDINAGDWVTTSARYAREHGESALGGDYRIVKEKVTAGELATDGNSPHEWGWWPSEARKAQGNALSPQGIEDTLKAKYPDAKISITESPTRGIVLNRIELPKDKRGQGTGSKIMAEILAEADARGATVALSPSGDFGGSVPRLKDFYSRFGFVPNKGRTADYGISESMYRPFKAGQK